MDRHWGQICHVTVDGTDFKVNEPNPFSPMYFSEKFNHAGLRYEVAICILTGWIVWVNGPFPCGTWPDLRIAREALHGMLADGEMYVADSGYQEGNQHCFTPDGSNSYEQRKMGEARARHETINGRFKTWKAMDVEWRHSLEKHGVAFRAIAVVTQREIYSGHKNFKVNWNEQEFSATQDYTF
jgi:hypothetical protein